MRRGFSIAECLITMAVMGVLLAPLTMSLAQSVQLQRKLQYTHSRNLLMDSYISQVVGGLNTFNTAFNDATAVTFGQNNANLCRMAKINTSGSTIFSRQALLYVYDPQSNNTCAGVGSGAKDAIPVTVQTDTFYMDVGSTAYTTDSQGNLWQPDAAYSSTNKVGGYNTVGSIGSTTDTVDNVLSASQSIYQNWRSADDLHYSFPVTQGSYWVELHFADYDHAVIQKSDIYMENTLVAASYSPYTAGGHASYHRGVILKYAIDVTDDDPDIDDVLDIKLIKTGASAVGLGGIAIYPKGAQGV